jgi:hypothetical protein
MEVVLDQIKDELVEVKAGIRNLYTVQSNAHQSRAQSQAPDWQGRLHRAYPPNAPVRLPTFITGLSNLDAAVLSGNYSEFACWQCESFYGRYNPPHQGNENPGL